MGFEIRRVPPGWEHPINAYCQHYSHDGFTAWARGKCFQPLSDGFASDLAKFEAMLQEKGAREATDYYGGAPYSGDYMDADWTEEQRTCFQIYENVGEGTPISPVFTTENAMETWLVEEAGYTAKAAAGFVKSGWGPSMVMCSDDNGVKIQDGIAAFGDELGIK